jgi:hypothetical protein
MPQLKLAKLPERTPVKLTIHVSPDLHKALGEYAAAYENSYGSSEEVTDLIPAMLAAFIEGDRAFARRRQESGK